MSHSKSQQLENVKNLVTPYIITNPLVYCYLVTSQCCKDRKENYGTNCVEEDDNPGGKCRGKDNVLNVS